MIAKLDADQDSFFGGATIVRAPLAFVSWVLLSVTCAVASYAAETGPKAPSQASPPPSLIWLAQPTVDQMRLAYPELAQRLGKSGQVKLSCIIDTTGVVSSCSVTEEAPANIGFGAAALALSKYFQADPKSAPGNRTVTIPLRFQMPGATFTEAEDIALCKPSIKPDFDSTIRGCSALIQSEQALPSLKAWAYISRGVAYGVAGQNQRAISDFTDSIAISTALNDTSSLSTEYGNRAVAYAHARLYPQAITDYEKLIELFPNNADALIGVAAVHGAMGNYDLAEREYSMAIIIKPSNAYYYLGRANLDAKNNHPDNAIADYSQFISMTEKLAVVDRSLDRAVAFAYSGRARSYDMKGEEAVALADAEKAVLLAPDYARAIETRAEIYERIGRRNGAIADYRAALKLQPKFKEAEEGLTRLGEAP